MAESKAKTSSKDAAQTDAPEDEKLEDLYANTTSGRPSPSGSLNAASHLFEGGGVVTGESAKQAELNDVSEADPREGRSGVAGAGTADARVDPEDDPNLQREAEKAA